MKCAIAGQLPVNDWRDLPQVHQQGHVEMAPWSQAGLFLHPDWEGEDEGQASEFPKHPGHCIRYVETFISFHSYYQYLTFSAKGRNKQVIDL